MYIRFEIFRVYERLIVALDTRLVVIKEQMSVNIYPSCADNLNVGSEYGISAQDE